MSIDTPTAPNVAPLSPGTVAGFSPEALEALRLFFDLSPELQRRAVALISRP